jgi:prepilin-type processing-associated H-X9-DG protein
LYKKQQGLTGTNLQSAAISVAMTPLNCLYCPSRRPVQTYPQMAALVAFDSGDNTVVGGAMTGSASTAGQALMIWDSSATTMSTSVATGLTSDAHTDYAGNGFSYSSLPLSETHVASFFTSLLAKGEYGAANDPVGGLGNVSIAEGVKAALSATQGGQGGIFYYGLAISIAQVQDGTSNTYLCGEKYIDANHYLDGLDYNVVSGNYGGDGDNICAYCGYDSDMIRFAGYDGLLPATVGFTPKQDSGGYQRDDIFGSAHAGMCNMAFCDGSVHQISYGIAATIHWQLSNRADGNAIDASMY